MTALAARATASAPHDLPYFGAAHFAAHYCVTMSFDMMSFDMRAPKLRGDTL
jgi:hypothetical protein